MSHKNLKHPKRVLQKKTFNIDIKEVVQPQYLITSWDQRIRSNYESKLLDQMMRSKIGILGSKYEINGQDQGMKLKDKIEG